MDSLSKDTAIATCSVQACSSSTYGLQWYQITGFVIKLKPPSNRTYKGGNGRWTDITASLSHFSQLIRGTF